MDYRAWYKKNRHVLRGSNRAAVRALKPIISTIDERAGIITEATRYAKDGSVGIIWSGMDCDCVSYSRSSVVAVNPISLHSYIMDSYNDAEGPLVHRFTTVEDAQSYHYTSRDLALEAYENGHPHVVYY